MIAISDIFHYIASSPNRESIKVEIWYFHAQFSVTFRCWEIWIIFREIANHNFFLKNLFNFKSQLELCNVSPWKRRITSNKLSENFEIPMQTFCKLRSKSFHLLNIRKYATMSLQGKFRRFFSSCETFALKQRRKKKFKKII